MMCQCGCGREVQANGKGRPAAYYSGACRVRRHRHKDVTKVSEDVMKGAQPVLTEMQRELLRIGQSISFRCVLLASSWGGVFIQAGRAGWTRYALSEKEERLGMIVHGVRRYADHLIDAGLVDGV